MFLLAFVFPPVYIKDNLMGKDCSMSGINKVGSLKSLLPGEEILHFVPSLGLATAKALPTYRVFFPIPLFLRASLYITDRRVLTVVYLFGLVIEEFSSWYPGCGLEDDFEIVESISVGRLNILGPYLEVISHNDNRPWYCRYLCAARLRLRFYMKNPETLYEIFYGRLNKQY